MTVWEETGVFLLRKVGGVWGFFLIFAIGKQKTE
jgi:hypothetical protein